MRTVHVLAVFALLSTSLMSALAQQPVSTTPRQAASASAPPPMVSRWVDAHGQVHYGDMLPPDAPDNAADVAPIESSTPEQRQQADQQLQQYRHFLQQPPVTPQGTAPQVTAASKAPPVDNSCAGQWARFNAAVACAAPYHVVGGGLRGDVSQHCPVVPQPQCLPPGS